MVATRVIVVVAVCGVLFAYVPTRADDTKPTELRKLALFPNVVIDADEAVTVLKRFGFGEVMRVPMFNALLVWGTDEELTNIREMLRPL